ncbi:MAG: GNAT family N-acetyltransferase [Actinobacteria bacterium]|nr:GNAT family N-acetyltransferase [Actinomycetota bacterium]
MSPALRLLRLPDDPARSGSIALRDAGVSARAHPYAGVPGMALVVVPDGSTVPAPQHFHMWATALARRGFTSLRTGALSPRQAEQAERAGLRCVQELALLELRDPHPSAAVAHRTHRLRPRHLGAAATIDRLAFGSEWWLDGPMLADVGRATPIHRSRIIRNARDTGATTGVEGQVGAFLVSGRAGRTGYIQRLAVHPELQRQGLASDVMNDALEWMHRARLQRSFVKTHVDNDAALRLYRGLGFVELPERLRVFEGPIPL